jgi:hypothetical protein
MKKIIKCLVALSMLCFVSFVSADINLETGESNNVNTDLGIQTTSATLDI